MTCTGCGNKVKSVLDRIPGVYKPQVTLISSTAAIELDSAIVNMNYVLPSIEKRISAHPSSTAITPWTCIRLRKQPIVLTK